MLALMVVTLVVTRDDLIYNGHVTKDGLRHISDSVRHFRQSSHNVNASLTYLN